jgi:DSF synthase
MSAVHPFVQPSPSEISIVFEAAPASTLWITLPEAVDGEPPHFSPSLLRSLMGILHSLKSRGVAWPATGAMQPVHYSVLKSAHPDYFSLGGDLALFRDCIARRDRDALFDYSKLCADMMYDWSSLLGQRATTIALVQGRALGGGFETALAADVIVAEEQSEFGFPEILFGLFPCTGGMSLLSQRIGARAAERMLGDGKIYGTEELHRMGVIDVVCPRGEGEVAVERYIAEHSRHRGARLMLQRARRRHAGLDRRELHTVVGEWTDLAMQLSPADLRVMEMLVKMQRGRAAA